MNANMPVTEGLASFRGYQVWYRIVGDGEAPGKLPLLCLHGGPGATHDYLEPLEAMAATGRRVIFYDQLGNGNSDHPHNPSLWTVPLFVEELGIVRQALGLEFEKLSKDPEVYNTMNGPSEFHVIGLIKDWDIVNRLSEIKVPTLAISGRYDEATPVIAETIQLGIPGSEWVLFENSAHVPHLEETERYLQVLTSFLDRIELQT
jgi:pimeloyl-ACP methyl ester carboxylesterase